MSTVTQPTVVTIHSRAEAAALVPSLLGFHPSESIVIIGVGEGMPTARIDFCEVSTSRLRDAILPAIHGGHWKDGCILAIFTEGEVNRAEILIMEAPTWLPGISVLDAFRVTNGECFGPWEATGQKVPAPLVETGPIAASRAELVPDAGSLTDVDQIITKAIAAWKSGNGASAWIYLDRLNELIEDPKDPPQRALQLIALLQTAVNPTEVEL